MYDGEQVVLNGCNLVAEVSLRLGKKVKEVYQLLLRDVAYYQEKLKTFGMQEDIR